MDRLYHNPFITYRRSPDNYYSSVIQDYSTQEPPSTNLSTPFYHPNCGAMATTDYLRPSNPPSSPPLNNVTSPSRLSSPHGLAISLQSYSAPNRQSSDDRASTSIESTLLPHSNVNATSAYSAPSYSNHPEIQEERVVGRNGGIGGANGQDWKTSLHAESREGGSLESAIGEPNSFKSTKKITGLGLGYSGEDGRVPTSSLSGALAEGGVSRSGFTSNQPSSSFQQASSSSFEGSFFSPQTTSNNHSGNGGSGVGDNSDVSAGSSRGSGKRASGLPIETDSSFNSSHSSQLHQAQHSNTTPSRTGPSRVDDNQPIYVHTFFPDNGEAGIPITIIATLNSDWASKIGLQSSDQSFEHSKSRGKLMVTFGNEDVEAKVERSFNPDDGRGQTDFNVNITVAAPSFASTQWTSTRVPISINIFGMDSNPTDLTIPGDGKEVGEFLYWLVSPRSALKRFGEPLEDEGRLDKPAKQSSSALRRPASYPALAASSDPADPSNLGQSSESNSNSYGRASGGTLNRSISHNRGNGSTSSAQSFHPSMHAMRHYRSDMGMSSNSPSQQSQSSFGTGPTPSPAVGSDRISGDFTFSVGRPNSINLPQNGFAGMGISGPSGAISPGGISRPDLSMDSDSRPVTANSASMGSPSISMDDRQLSHSSSINSLNASFNSMRRGSAGYSPALPGGSTFSPSSPVPNNQSSKPKATPPSNLTKKEVPSASGSGGAAATVKAGSRAVLQTHGELQDMAVGWSHDEYMSSRRLVQFWRRQDGTTIHMTFRPILPHQYVQNSIVVSCIFREDKNECFITSVDLIYLLEALVASRFTIEEKNRIRRNLEGFKPSTVAKGKNDSSEFFKVIMNFPNPKPRNIEKDVKVFPWSVLGKALSKIIGKYSAAPPAGPSEPVQTNNNNAPTSPSDQQQHLPSLTSPFSPTPSVMAGNQPAFHPSPRSNGQYGQFSPGQPSSMNGNGNGMGMASNLGGPSSSPYNSNRNNYSHDNPYQQQAYHQSPNFKDGSSHYSGGY